MAAKLLALSANPTLQAHSETDTDFISLKLLLLLLSFKCHATTSTGNSYKRQELKCISIDNLIYVLNLHTQGQLLQK